jgi:hypothetical protein
MKKILSCGFAALFSAALFSVVAADADKKLPEGKPLLTAGGLKSARLSGGENNRFGEFEIVEVKDQPFAQAIRARVKTMPVNPWVAQISTLTAQPVKQGDAVLVSFYVRSIESKNEGGKGRLTVYFGIPDGPEPTVAQEIVVGATWTKVQIPARVAADYEAVKSMLNLDLGYEPQVLEFADIKVMNFGAKVKLGELPSTGT